MVVYFGTAGIPLSAKGKSTLNGIKRVKELGLSAMEIEFVRSIYLNEKIAQEAGELAKELAIRLSVHAPYYINLCSKDEKIVDASKQRIIKSAKIGEILGAGTIAIHAAYYHEPKERTFEVLRQNFLDILDRLGEYGISHVKLGIEVMGKDKMFGSLDEVILLCKEINHDQLVPYLDFGHIFVRNKGAIDYAEIFDELEKLKLDHINSHFEGVAKNNRGEFVDVHTPIGPHPPFKPLAKEILERKLDITIISESPMLEDDSLKMKEAIESLR